MADVFISYKKEDRALAEKVETALKASGLTSWWDTSLHPRESWDAIIQREIAEATAVIVIWTPRSVDSEWVRIEATYGKQHKKLVPVLAEPSAIPLAFMLTQTAGLIEWDGSIDHPGWQQVLSWINALRKGAGAPEQSQVPAEPITDPSPPTADPSAERKQAFALIDRSLSRKDYQVFLDRYPDGVEAFEASRRLQQLERWQQVKDRPEDIGVWMEHVGDVLFPALEQEALKRQGRLDEPQRPSSSVAPWVLGGGVVLALALGVFLWLDPYNLISSGAPETADLEYVNESEPPLPDYTVGTENGFATQEALEAWQAAERTDTAEAYADFVEAFPDSRFVDLALARMDAKELDAVTLAAGRDNDAWDAAQAADTIAAYRGYLDAHPEGFYAEDARARIEALTPTEPAFTPGDTFRDCDDCPEMVVIPAGEFVMGSPPDEEGRQDDEGPQRTVRIDYQFAVGKYEVTWAEWEACVADGGCQLHPTESWKSHMSWGLGSMPVIHVTWRDAQDFARWLTIKTGEDYRLLSEAEWEYSARGFSTLGVPTYRFGWGDEDPVCASGLQNASNHSACFGYEPTEVGFSAPNRFGLHDMHGNVMEWTLDCYEPNYYSSPVDGSSLNTERCNARVVRGGFWGSSTYRALRSANRAQYNPNSPMASIGFRIARAM